MRATPWLKTAHRPDLITKLVCFSLPSTRKYDKGSFFISADQLLAKIPQSWSIIHVKYCLAHCGLSKWPNEEENSGADCTDQQPLIQQPQETTVQCFTPTKTTFFKLVIKSQRKTKEILCLKASAKHPDKSKFVPDQISRRRNFKRLHLSYLEQKKMTFIVYFIGRCNQRSTTSLSKLNQKI